jgi:hypothetical protein
MTAPRTEAGRLYLAWNAAPELWEPALYERFGRMWTYREIILAIEAEAVALALAELRTEVEGLLVRTEAAMSDEGYVCGHVDGPCGFRNAVLAAIDRTAKS